MYVLNMPSPFSGRYMTEADTCRTPVITALRVAGWEQPPHLLSKQHYFTDDRLVIVGLSAKRSLGKKADYILRYTRDVPIAFVEATAEHVNAGDGMQQAKDYARILGLAGDIGRGALSRFRRRSPNPKDFLRYKMPLPSRQTQFQLCSVATVAAELGALLPAVLDKEFRGKL
jgi:hypothetical protein